MRKPSGARGAGAFGLTEPGEALGGIVALVNNADFFQPNVPFADLSLASWRRHFAVNADGSFLGCRQTIRRMAPGGAVVNIGSGMSITANPTAAAYCGSKAAVLMTTRTAAAAAGPRGIRVNAVLPGPVDAAMLMGNLIDGEEPAAYLEKLTSSSPLGRLATAKDIARATVFLCDPASAAITGVYLPVDGGNMPGA
jgi:NAD(P)-dependent dehydrogenase (short-subunit alcohol dehydrogenase family)